MQGRRTPPVAAILAAGVMLAWPAIHNGYPLIFADTGTYLGQAIQRYLGWDRPGFYSLFLHALHWRTTLWPIPLAQGLIVAHLLYLMLRVLGRPGAVPLLLVAGVLAIGTGLPWAAAQLMPDVFTGVVVLALWLVGFGWDRLRRGERAYLLLLASGATVVHLSHVPLALGLAVVGAALGWRAGGLPGAGLVALRMAIPPLLAALALVAANTVAFGRPSLSPFGSVFLAARLLEDGPALRTLDQRCPAGAEWQVCALRDRLPMPANHFLWPTEGPLRGELGGGKAWAAEAREIVRETLAREPGAVVAAGLINTVRQFGMLGTGDGLSPWPAEHGPEPIIEEHFPRELEAYRTSRQSRGLLERDAAAVSPLHLALAWVGLMTLPFLAVTLWRRQRSAALCILVLAASVGNAAITGALSGANERYQARIAWLFVLAPTVAALADGRPGERADRQLRLSTPIARAPVRGGNMARLPDRG
jgi:hypothetical protein